MAVFDPFVSRRSVGGSAPPDRGKDMSSLLNGDYRGRSQFELSRSSRPNLALVDDPILDDPVGDERLPEEGRIDPAAPTYKAKLPDTRETRRRYFSENTVPMNTIVISHHAERDAVAGRAIVRALHQANPNARIALLVENFDKRDPKQLTELARYYGLPERALAPIRVTGSTRSFGLFPQDGFIAGAGGLNEPRSGTRHANDVAEAISRATGIQVNHRDYLGMGGDTHFLTRPNGRQVAYFGQDTIDHSLSSLNKSRPVDKQFNPADHRDRLLTIGHVMASMNDAGLSLTDVAPLGISPSGRTYGSVMDKMSPEQRAELRSDVLARLEEMRELPFPESYPTNAKGSDYHTDLVIASPDGVHAYVNSDDLADFPAWRRQLEFFGYKPVALPASYSFDDLHKSSTRRSYTNWIMGEVDGKTVILLPTDADDPTKLTVNDKKAIAAIQTNNPNVKIIPIGGATTRLFQDYLREGARNWGPHCRTNVLPWTLETAKPGTTSFKGAAANDPVVANPPRAPVSATRF